MKTALLLLATFTSAGVLFVTGEVIRRRLKMSNEVSRKLVHAIHAATVATLPFVIDYKIVIGLEVLFIISVFIAEQLKLFHWLWVVGRKSWGEYAYPVGIIAALLLSDTTWVYLIAVLQLGLADAAAALVGKKYGRGNSYKIMGQKKSIIGTAAFFVVSGLILVFAIYVSPEYFSHANAFTVIWLAALLSATENLGVYGLDNSGIPVITAVVLNALR